MVVKERSSYTRSCLLLVWVIALILAAWQALSYFFPEMRYVIASPSEIVGSFLERGPRLFFHAKTTLKTVLLSLGISSFLSIPLAVLMYRWSSLSFVMQFFFVVFESLPTFCLAPILIMWFGWGICSALIPCILSALLSQTLILWRALKATPLHFLEYFSTLGATPWMRFWKLEFPHALPSFFSGMRIAAAIAGVSALATEWVGQEAGLGVLILEMREEVDIAGCFSALLCIFGLSTFLYLSTVLLEKTLISPQKKLLFSRFFLFLLCLFPLSPLSSYSLVLDWQPSPTHIPLYAGQEWGIFDEEAVPLTIVKPGLIDPIQLLLSGKTDLCISHLPHVLRLKAGGLPLEIVGTLVEKPLNGFMAHSNETLFQGDGKGKVLGFMGSSFSSKSLAVFLKRGGWSEATTVQVRSDLVSRFLSGSIDVAYGVYRTIEPLQCQSLDCPVTFHGVEEFGFPSYHELVIISLDKGALIQEGKVPSFQRALQRSIDRSICDSDDAFLLYRKRFPDKSQRGCLWEEKAWLATKPLFSKKQVISQPMLDALMEWYVRAGILSDRKVAVPFMSENN